MLHQPTDDFVNCFYSYGFHPLIDQPTRITSHSSTLIDNILTNNDCDDTLAGFLNTDISDHLPIFQITPSFFLRTNPASGTYVTRNVNSDTMRSFSADIEDMDWGPVYECQQADSAYDTFLTLFSDIYNRNFPLISRKTGKKNNQPWITQSIINSCNHKNRLYRRFLRNPSEANRRLYKNYRNRLTTIIRLVKKSYYANKFKECKTNMKSSWQEINKILGKGKKADVPDDVRDGQHVYSDPSDIANAFNSYFTNIGSSLANNIPQTSTHFMDYLHDSNNSSLFLTPTHSQEIIEIGNKLNSNTSCGFDDIRPSVVKSVISFISHPLAHICNLSFLTGSVPANLKIAKVTPVFKTGDHQDIHNYRPISVLPCFSKILERLVYNRLSKFLSRFNILYDQQFGFRAQHSTDMALIHLTDVISTSLCNKLSTAAIFIDLSKAFDTIDHNILLSKLDFYGVRGRALEWFQDYLFNRHQYTVINKTDSLQETITHGVLQGSILGPLLFLLYINDIRNSSSLLSFLLFADDTTIVCSSPSYQSLVHTCDTEFINVSWFKSNKLSLNATKTKCMFFSKTKQPNVTDLSSIYIDSVTITQVQSTKLGSCPERQTYLE